ncbi:MAG TPA: hypothetical protein GX406_05465 [Pseudoclavibacter sp.]|nr:hypothetical protein [Pseudoclavibacter sp.]
MARHASRRSVKKNKRAQALEESLLDGQSPAPESTGTAQSETAVSDASSGSTRPAPRHPSIRTRVIATTVAVIVAGAIILRS